MRPRRYMSIVYTVCGNIFCLLCSQLLHDVSLVVSRCRLLGEELRLLKLWGGLRLDILDISCMDTK